MYCRTGWESIKTLKSLPRTYTARSCQTPGAIATPAAFARNILPFHTPFFFSAAASGEPLGCITSLSMAATLSVRMCRLTALNTRWNIGFGPQIPMATIPPGGIVKR